MRWAPKKGTRWNGHHKGGTMGWAPQRGCERRDVTGGMWAAGRQREGRCKRLGLSRGRCERLGVNKGGNVNGWVSTTGECRWQGVNKGGNVNGWVSTRGECEWLGVNNRGCERLGVNNRGMWTAGCQQGWGGMMRTAGCQQGEV